MRNLFLSVAMSWPLMTSPSLASELAAETIYPDHVLELYTSQGCSSCPPANEFVADIAEEESVLALSFSVTYWDYLGWKDTFADPAFTQRQKEYGKAFDGAIVYTPQLILNGSTHASRMKRDDVLSMPLAPKDLALNFTLRDDGILTLGLGTQGLERLNLALAATDTDDETYKAYIASSDTEDDTFQQELTQTYNITRVRYIPGPQSVPVERGENGGRILQLANIVTDVKTLNDIDVRDFKEIVVTNQYKPDQAYAILVYSPDQTRILAAAVFKPNI